jgi:hypothetical protein
VAITPPMKPEITESSTASNAMRHNRGLADD